MEQLVPLVEALCPGALGAGSVHPAERTLQGSPGRPLGTGAADSILSSGVTFP